LFVQYANDSYEEDEIDGNIFGLKVTRVFDWQHICYLWWTCF